MTENINRATTQLSLDSRISFIDNYSLFSLLNADDKRELALLIQEKQVEPGTRIVSEGDIVDSIYFIFSGTADVTQENITDEKKQTVFLATLKSGNAIGLNDTGFFSHYGFRLATVTATSPMTLGSIDIHSLNMFLEKPSVSYPGLKTISEKIVLMNFIEKINLFTHLNKSDLQKIACNISKVYVPANNYLFKQGDSADKCYFVITGQLAVVITDKNNEEHILKKIEPGDMIGEGAFLANERRNAAVNAQTDCELFVLEKSHLDVLKGNKHFLELLKKTRIRQLRPVAKSEINILQGTNRKNQQIICLSHPETHVTLDLSAEEFSIWQQLDGKNTLGVILENYPDPENDKSLDKIYQFIIRLQKSGFIQLDINLQSKTESLLKRGLKKIVEFISNGCKREK